MATNSSKQPRIDKSYKIKYKVLKELEKSTPHKDVARMFEVPKNTLIYENYERGLGATKVKPGKYEAVNKAVMKWLLIMRSENIPINGPMFKEKAQEFAEQLNLKDFHASSRWLEKLKKTYTCSPFMVFPSTFITHEYFLFAFKKKNIVFANFPDFPMEDVQLHSHYFC